MNLQELKQNSSRLSVDFLWVAHISHLLGNVGLASCMSNNRADTHYLEPTIANRWQLWATRRFRNAESYSPSLASKGRTRTWGRMSPFGRSAIMIAT